MVNKYRRHLVPLAETATEVICTLVVRDETNVQFTYGGKVVRFIKPVTQIALDAAVMDIVDNGDQGEGVQKKWTENDERGITRVAPSRESRRLGDWSVQRNRADWPSLYQRRTRG